MTCILKLSPFFAVTCNDWTVFACTLGWWDARMKVRLYNYQTNQTEKKK
jgi:hypothetical protein